MPDLFSGPVNIKWQDGAPAPVVNVFHTAVLLDGKVYTGGGDGLLSLRRIDIYNPASNSWSPSPINTPIKVFAMTTLNNQLITAGGFDRNDKVSNKIFLLDRDHLKEYTRMITPRYQATAVGYQGTLIITGGRVDYNSRLDSTELFNSTTGQWYSTDTLPSPKLRPQSVIVDNVLYLLGGLYNFTVYTAPLDTLSTHQLKWSSQQPIPGSGSASFSIQGRHLLTVGGFKGDMITRDIHKFNKISHRWEVIGQIPSARFGTAAVSVADNKIVVVGGYDDKNHRTNTVWLGSLEPQ